MRLIDADALRDRGEILYMHTCSGRIIPVNAVSVWAINNAPTIDAEPVVRCKDCKHWKPCAGATEHVKCCEWAGYMIGENGYCVYGEVKKR